MAAIIETQNDYLVKVKRNQPLLYAQIEQKVKSSKAVKRYINDEKTRNRQTIREVEVFDIPNNLDNLWQDAGCVIRVKRSGNRGLKSV